MIIMIYYVLMMYINLNDFFILNIHGDDYHCIINGISKSQGINLMQNTDLTEKAECYKT